MTQFKSEELTIPYDVNIVYPVLSDLRTLELLKEDFSSDKIKDLRFEKDVCFLSISPIGEVGLRVIERSVNQHVKLMGEETVPFKLFLNIDLKFLDNLSTQVQFVLDADLSPILRMIATPSINDFLKKASEAISKLDYISLNKKCLSS